MIDVIIIAGLDSYDEDKPKLGFDEDGILDSIVPEGWRVDVLEIDVLDVYDRDISVTDVEGGSNIDSVVAVVRLGLDVLERDGLESIDDTVISKLDVNRGILDCSVDNEGSSFDVIFLDGLDDATNVKEIVESNESVDRVTLDVVDLG